MDANELKEFKADLRWAVPGLRDYAPLEQALDHQSYQLLTEVRVSRVAVHDPITGNSERYVVAHRWPDGPGVEGPTTTKSLAQVVQHIQDRKAFEAEYGWDESIMSVFERKPAL